MTTNDADFPKLDRRTILLEQISLDAAVKLSPSWKRGRRVYGKYEFAHDLFIPSSFDYDDHVDNHVSELSILSLIARYQRKYRGKFENEQDYNYLSLLSWLREEFGLIEPPIENIEFASSECWQQVSESKILKYFIKEIVSILLQKNIFQNVSDSNKVTDSFDFATHLNGQQNLMEFNLTLSVFKKMINDITKASGISNYFFLNFDLFWSLYQFQIHPPKIKRTKFEFIEEILNQTSNYHFFHHQKYGIILLLHGSFTSQRQKYRDLIGISKDKNLLKVHNEGFEPKSKSDLKKYNLFLQSYNKYIQGLSNLTLFTHCASKLTRLDKLYKKPLEFSYTPHTSSNLFLLEKRLFALANYEISEKTDKNRAEIDRRILNVAMIHFEEILLILKRYKEKNETNEFTKIFSKIITKLDRPHPIRSINEQTLINQHQMKRKAFLPFIITGDAGMGKTISISQAFFDYVNKIKINLDSEVKQNLTSHHLPFFLKCKRFRNFAGHELNDLLPSVAGKSLYNIQKQTLPRLGEYISEKEFIEMYVYWADHQLEHHSSHAFFIDGLDECSSTTEAKACLDLIYTSNTFRTMFSPLLLISTRPAYFAIVERYAQENWMQGFFVAEMKQNEYYSTQELSTQMPVKLCDAWGITQESGEKLNDIFSKYEEVLIHPLFIGWFCFLIFDDKLDEIEKSSEQPELLRNNLIAKIIDIGIQSSLERRESKFLYETEREQNFSFVKILKTFVAYSVQFKIDEPKEIFERMEADIESLQITEELKYSILEDCGILFLSGEHIEWTHPTVSEVMYADFYFENDSSKYLGPLTISAPILSRLAQHHYESGIEKSYEIALLKLHHEFSQIDFKETYWDMFGEPWITALNSKLIVLEGLTDLESACAQLYIDSLNSKLKFSVFIDTFDMAKWDEIRPILNEVSHCPFLSDVLDFEEGNRIKLEELKIDKINSKTRVSDCFAFYRNLLLVEDYQPPDLNDPGFQIHKRAGNFNSLFSVREVSGWSTHENYPASTWLQEFKQPNRFQKEHNRWFNPRKELIHYITQEYITTAFNALFGKKNGDACINYLFEQLHEIEVYVLIDSENGVVEERRLLEVLFERQGFSDFSLDEIDKENIVVRGFSILPFVDSCLTEANRDLFDDLIDRNNGHWNPYEMILEYAKANGFTDYNDVQALF